MPAPKDVAKLRAARIRERAIQRFYECFSQKLEELADQGRIPRNKDNMPQGTAAAELMGIDQPTVSSILDKHRVPRADRLAVICETLGISADDMLGLPTVDPIERARRRSFDFVDPVERRRLYELLKLEFEGAPKELEAADLETSPKIRSPELPPESGRQTGDTRPLDATKHVGKRRRPKR